MEVHLKPETEARLQELAVITDRPPEELVQNLIEGAITDYFDSLKLTRETLDSRYDDIKSGRVQPIDGETFFENLQQREADLLKRRSQK